MMLCTAPATAGADTDYYAGVARSSPQAMRESLHEIIDDHLRFPYTAVATDTWDVLEIADENQDSPEWH
jgi:hypothetical protein